MPATARPSVVVALAALVALITALVPATAAYAHTDLRSSTPAEGDSVATLDEVSLQFTSTLLDIGTELSLVDAEGTTTALEPTFPAEDTVAAAVETGLAPGDAQLVWRVVAEDGHPIEGVIDFTFVPDGATEGAPDGATDAGTTSPSPSAEPSDAASAAPVPSPTDSPTESASEAPSASASPSPSPSATGDAESDNPAWLWWVVGAVVIGGAATALAMVTRRRPTA
ncbi:copper resistance CopC family protein [Demequina sp. NBRC 110051]|uniref:copper resistance CopC family protein n=1 Tax=Demequina sp. NBRC 110051 TaxID=1570340 RepID=UPI0013566059|nr:copper resistance CopC family protein [Demequina sp. NBRC 110051]